MSGSRGVTVHIVVSWSSLNSPDRWIGSIITNYNDSSYDLSQALLIATLSGVLYHNSSPVVVPIIQTEEITHFFKDPRNPTKDEIESLEMVYPAAKTKKEK